MRPAMPLPTLSLWLGEPGPPAKRDPMAKGSPAGHRTCQPQPGHCKEQEGSRQPPPRAQAHPAASSKPPHCPWCAPAPYLPRADPRGNWAGPGGQCWCPGCDRGGVALRGLRYAGTGSACSAGAACSLVPLASPGCRVPAVAGPAGGAGGGRRAGRWGAAGTGLQPGKGALRGGGGGGW